jgi:hypothetical protein
MFSPGKLDAESQSRNGAEYDFFYEQSAFSVDTDAQHR